MMGAIPLKDASARLDHQSSKGNGPGNDDNWDVMLLAVLIKILEASVEDDVCRSDGNQPNGPAQDVGELLALLQLLFAKFERVSVTGDALKHLPERVSGNKGQRQYSHEDEVGVLDCT